MPSRVVSVLTELNCCVLCLVWNVFSFRLMPVWCFMDLHRQTMNSSVILPVSSNRSCVLSTLNSKFNNNWPSSPEAIWSSCDLYCNLMPFIYIWRLNSIILLFTSSIYCELSSNSNEFLWEFKNLIILSIMLLMTRSANKFAPFVHIPSKNPSSDVKE
jgi:hypothetical protein